MAVQDYFDSLIAYNPDNEELVAGAAFQVYAVDDASYSTPLPLTDPVSGAAITTLQSSNIGVLPDFRVAGEPQQVILKSGAFVTKLTSRLGVFKDAGFDPDEIALAIAAAPAAEAARDAALAAQAAAEAVGTTNDTVMTTVAADEDSAFAGHLRGTIDAGVVAGTSELNAASFGAVADSDGTNGSGTDNRSAIQNALNTAASLGIKAVRISAPEDAGKFFRVLVPSTTTEGSTGGVAIKIPAGVELRLSPGVKFWGERDGSGTSLRVLFLAERAHGAGILGKLHVRGSMSSLATNNGICGFRDYRSKGFTLNGGVDMDGVSETISVVANESSSTDTTEDFRIIGDSKVGPNLTAGPHLFGVHRRTRIEGRLEVLGTLRYDAFQLEAVIAGPYLEASEDFYCRELVVQSSAYRGVFINPHNRRFTFDKVYVRKPGRLPDGTIVGYDQGTPTRVVTNACLTVSSSDGKFGELDLDGGLAIDSTIQPAISGGWSTGGYAIALLNAIDVQFTGRVSFGTNDTSDVYVDTSDSGWSARTVEARFRDAARVPTVTRGNATYAPAVVTERSPSKFPANAPMINTIRGWNIAGPDGALNPRLTATDTTATVEAGGLVAPSRYRITATTNSFGGLSIPLSREVALAKGGVAHLLMLAKADAPANLFSWAIAGLTNRRIGINEFHSARDYQAGQQRWIHSIAAYDAADAFNNPPTLRLWHNYGAAASGLDLTFEGIWLFVAPYADVRPTFDFSHPLLSTAAPTQGQWAKGQTVEQGSPAASGNLGWICTAGGTPGTWKSYGTIAA
ncbi:hypothetical protein ACEYYH_10405 [Microbacterium trichothecenolyticum]|uniref:hypothetical protein n=1 Tax=Microbacterium trichothecenolyticum TaxID=69370 RepID=UPI0035BE9604